MNNFPLKKISIVVPAKNEQDTLSLVLSDIIKVIKNITNLDFEIIVVDDHSIDNTFKIAESFGAKIIKNERTSGKGYALITGFENATGDAIIMLDADYSHGPEDIPVFISLLQRGFGLVVGSRITGGSEEYTLVRGFGNIVLTISFWFMTGIFITDALNGFKAFRRELFLKNKYYSKDFEIEIELLINALLEGYKIGEFPCHERVRAGGKMKSHAFRHGVKIFQKIFTKGLKYRFYKFFLKKHG